MVPVSIRYLTLFNFRSFKGEHKIDFPESGLFNLRGDNRDSRGDSGAGKTNVLLAIAYLFHYCQFPSKALQCWGDEEAFYVECGLSDGTVVRRSAGGLTVGKFRGTTAEEKLDEICGVDRKLRELLTYKDQVAPKNVLAMEDKQLKDFLVQVLGKEIEKLDDAIDDAKAGHQTAEMDLIAAVERARAAEQELERARGACTPPETHDVQTFTSGVAAARTWCHQTDDEASAATQTLRLAELAARQAVAAITAEWEDAARKLEARAADCRAEALPEVDRAGCAVIELDIAKCKGFIADLTEQDKTAWAAYEAVTAKLRKEARSLHNELAKLSHLTDDEDRLGGEIESLGRDVCSTCERPWNNAKVKLAEKLSELAEVQKKVAELKAHRPRAVELDTEIASRLFVHDPRIDKLYGVLTQLGERLAVEDEKAWAAHRAAEASVDARARGYERDAKMARMSARAEAQERFTNDAAVKAARARSEQAAEAHRRAREQKNQLETDLRVAEAHNASAADAHRRACAAAVAAEARYQKMVTACLQQETLVKAETDYLALLVGFRNKIFDETLTAIGAEASQILATLPNAQHIVIDFASERTTGKGTVQERVIPIAYLNGVRRPLRESVSGGQVTSVSLAVDLATARVVSRRLGCSLNWMILDESFGGHDATTKTACLEMLRGYAANKLVIVVDHAAEVRDMFDRIVTVTMEGGTSRLS